ncbi:hypothetical protein U1Q18_010990 [Sarracenia purpurea var. burkii]
MEGVGARLGRSSTRYGTPSTVFNGPVRKWKKKWIHVSPPTNAAASNHHHSQTANHNGNNGSHLLLYKWIPISQSQNNSNGDKSSSAKDEFAAAAANATSAAEEPPRRKFKYIPIALLEEQNNEAAEKVDDEDNLIHTGSRAAQPTSKSDTLDEKPDINDVPMEENQVPHHTSLARQDLNESTLDLSLG